MEKKVNKAGAPKGNTNAEKWDLESARILFLTAIELTKQLEEEEDPKSGYKFDFIGEVAGELNTYHHNFNHLVNRFPELKSLKTQLISNLERNCYYNTKKGKIREATGIVNLKSNHKWTDRADLTSGDKPVNTRPTIIFTKAGAGD